MVGIAQVIEESVQKIEDFYTVRHFSGHRLILSVCLRHYLVSGCKNYAEKVYLHRHLPTNVKK